MLRGAPGSQVHLKIQRDDQVLEFDLIRQVREYVTSRMLPDGIGYISLNAFNQHSQPADEGCSDSAYGAETIGLIWDLRNNEGGDMQAAQDILSYFIKDGLLFTAELTHDRTVQFRAKGKRDRRRYSPGGFDG